MADFFTRDGDDGNTGILGKGRISKAHPRIEVLGSIDEASAALGIVRSANIDVNLQDTISTIQRDLYFIMAEVAASPENKANFSTIEEKHIAWLEEQSDQYSSHVKIPNEFILPGDTPIAASISFARTVIRRAERRLIELQESGEIVNPILLKYLNRLSSLCFILELVEREQKKKLGS